jgi:signal transduction histidine kinase
LLARYENEKQTFNNEKVYLNGIIQDILIRKASLIKLNNLTIKVIMEADYYCESDKQFVSIIITNLISNAIKYSNPSDAIEIHLNKKQHEIICSIIDNGIGIPSADLEKIFQPFFRSKALNHPNIKGIGVGLSIVQRLCSILSIGINISSIENTGTKVELIFQEFPN